MINFNHKEKNQDRYHRYHDVNRLDKHHRRMNPYDKITDHTASDCGCNAKYQNAKKIQTFLNGNHGT